MASAAIVHQNRALQDIPTYETQQSAVFERPGSDSREFRQEEWGVGGRSEYREPNWILGRLLTSAGCAECYDSHRRDAEMRNCVRVDHAKGCASVY